MIGLSKRLKALLDTIPTNDGTIVDIGCDHGKLITCAVLSGKCNDGIGVDISQRSLSKAIQCAEKRGLSDRISFKLGDGYSVINKKINVTIIAGLGGIEITHILSQPHNSNYYILSPHQDALFLREYMRDNSFHAIKDFVVEERGKFYPIILAEKGECDYTDYELLLGKNFPENSDYILRNEQRLLYLNNIAKQADNGNKLSLELKKEWSILQKWQKLKK